MPRLPRTFHFLGALVAAGCLAAVPAAAQIKLGSKATLSASTRLRYESWDWFDPGTVTNGNHTYGFFAAQSHLVFKADPTAWLGVTADAEHVAFLGLPEDANAAPPFGDLGLGASYFASHRDANDARLFLHQGFATLRNPKRPATYLKAGRFEYLDGVEVMAGEPTLDWLKRTRLTARLVGTFGFSHVMRSFDGATAAWDRPKYNLTALAAHPRQGGFEIEGGKEISEVDIAGLTLTVKPGTIGKRNEARLFYLYYADGRSPADLVTKVDNRPAPVRAADSASIGMSQVGGHFIQSLPGKSGTADLLGWGVYQTGHWGLLKHRAWAGAVEAGYQFTKAPARPWIRAGYFRSSGDDDNTDGTHRTFFQTLTTVRLYAQFPFFNMMNNKDLFAQVVLRPVPNKLAIRGDLHRLWLSDKNDLWYVGSGATQRRKAFGYGGRPSGGSDDLGTLADLSVTWDPATRITVYGYFGHVSGGKVVSSIYPGTSGSFAYLETTLRF